MKIFRITQKSTVKGSYDIRQVDNFPEKAKNKNFVRFFHFCIYFTYHSTKMILARFNRGPYFIYNIFYSHFPVGGNFQDRSHEK